MHAITLKVASSMVHGVMQGLVAGMIYFVIAFTTGAPALTSMAGGIVVAAVAMVIGQLVRVIYERRVLRGPE
jgi:phosphate/sulfate permease